jgi:polymerase delta-interacting protein 2
LAEVGKLQTVKTDGNYSTGQLFLHKVFGYRGVVLFPWQAKVYDRDANQVKSDEETTAISGDVPNVNNKEVQKRTHTYYQVLIDQRDCPFIRAQTEAVTFLGNNQESSRSLYAIPGLDYVAHSDIIPYQTFESTALSHELFDKFLTRTDSDPPFTALETLKAWQKKNHTFLELSDVHIETTNSIRVTVIPFYMGCRETPSSSVYWVSRSIVKLLPISDASLPVALLHPPRESRRVVVSTSRKTLENLLPLRNARDCARSRNRRARAHPEFKTTRFPVLQSRQPTSAFG